MKNIYLSAVALGTLLALSSTAQSAQTWQEFWQDLKQSIQDFAQKTKQVIENPQVQQTARQVHQTTEKAFTTAGQIAENPMVQAAGTTALGAWQSRQRSRGATPQSDAVKHREIKAKPAPTKSELASKHEVTTKSSAQPSLITTTP